MAFSPVPGKLDGDPFMGSDFVNKYIRDNFMASPPDVFEAKGDLFAGTGVDTGAIVSVGPDGSYLWADDSQEAGVVWGVTNRVRAGSASNQNVATLSDFPIKVTLYGTEVYDTGSAFASNRFTATHPGYYLITAFSVISNANATASVGVNDVFYLQIYKNGAVYSTIAQHIVQSGHASTHLFALTAMDIVYLSTGEYVEVYTYSDFGTGSSNVMNSGGSAATQHMAIQPLV